MLAKDTRQPVRLQEVEVVGLLTEDSFHMAVGAAEVITHKLYSPASWEVQ